jgi:leader peptidase (prepilin peptidase) / N-methyltransferase
MIETSLPAVGDLPAASTSAAVEVRLLRSPATLAPLLLGVVVLAIATLPLDRAIVGAFAACVLVVLSAIDIESGIIPNRIVLPAAGVVFLAQSALFPGKVLEWALAAILAAFVLMIPHLFQRAWMGMGDVKLALLLGVTLGWGVLGAVLLAFLCTFPAALVVLLRDGMAARKTTIPFGPFLAIGALIVLFAPHITGLPTT